MPVFYNTSQEIVEKPAEAKVLWRVAAYALILSSRHEILMVTSMDDPTRKMLPGGEVEMSETLMDALQRECYEETGYGVEPESPSLFFVGESYFYHQEFFRSLSFVYKARLQSTIQDSHVINATEENEIASVEWVPAASLTRENCKLVIYPAIQLLQKELGLE